MQLELDDQHRTGSSKACALLSHLQRLMVCMPAVCSYPKTSGPFYHTGSSTEIRGTEYPETRHHSLLGSTRPRGTPGLLYRSVQ